MTMNMNDVYVAQERYADMRQEAARESANAQMMDGTAQVRSNMVASVIERVRLQPYDGKSIVVGIRAENMETLAEPVADALKVSVLVVEPLGSQNLLTVKIGSNTVKVSTHPSFAIVPDQDVWLRFPADKIRWIDRDSGQVLYPA